jgi:hypothetical protein
MGDDASTVRSELVTILAPEAAYLRTDEDARYSVGVEGLTEAAQMFYNALAVGFFSAVMMEIVKGSVREVGRTVGTHIQSFLASLWGGGASTGTFEEAVKALREARSELAADHFDAALAAGRAALEAQLVRDGFPLARAQRVAEAYAKVAAKLDG